MPATETSSIAVEVVYAVPGHCWRLSLQLDPASTVADAVARFEHEGGCPHRIDPADGIAIFGKICALSTRLRDGDRVELLRPLQIDPKHERRERARRARR